MREHEREMRSGSLVRLATSLRVKHISAYIGHASPTLSMFIYLFKYTLIEEKRAEREQDELIHGQLSDRTYKKV